MEAHVSIIFFRKDVAKDRKPIQQIATELSVKPDMVLQKGVRPFVGDDGLRYGIKPPQDALKFEYKSKNKCVSYVEREFNGLLKRFLAIKPELDEAFGPYRYDTCVSIALYSNGQVNPGVILNAAAVRLLAKFNNGSFEVDIYCTDKESS